MQSSSISPLANHVFMDFTLCTGALNGSLNAAQYKHVLDNGMHTVCVDGPDMGVMAKCPQTFGYIMYFLPHSPDKLNGSNYSQYSHESPCYPYSMLTPPPITSSCIALSFYTFTENKHIKHIIMIILL